MMALEVTQALSAPIRHQKTVATNQWVTRDRPRLEKGLGRWPIMELLSFKLRKRLLIRIKLQIRASTTGQARTESHDNSGARPAILEFAPESKT